MGQEGRWRGRNGLGRKGGETAGKGRAEVDRMGREAAAAEGCGGRLDAIWEIFFPLLDVVLNDGKMRFSFFSGGAI